MKFPLALPACPPPALTSLAVTGDLATRARERQVAGRDAFRFDDSKLAGAGGSAVGRAPGRTGEAIVR